ncbi:hypothetical protein AAFP30_15925 [Gordonia sp. CPCC 205515]|uniref:hypothetical protein n=1 Tax=Gordonia sp. CPCC 205515 TaxID=3140791 RepID=UPI003AF387D0
MTHPRGRAGGLAGGAGYFLQSQYIALHLAQLLQVADGVAQLVEVSWERKALDRVGSAEPVDLLVNDVVLRYGNGDLVLVEVKASAPGARWTIDGLFREGVITHFWRQRAMLPPDLRDHTTLRLATPAPAPELTDVIDNARRSRSVAEMLSSNASVATEHATMEIGRRLGLEEGAEELRAFLGTIDVEPLPTGDRLNDWIQQQAPAIEGIDIASALINLVDRGKAAGPRATSSYTAASLRRDLEAVTPAPGRPQVSTHSLAGALVALRLGSPLDELATMGSLGHRIAAVAEEVAHAGFDPAHQIDGWVLEKLRHQFHLPSDTDDDLAADISKACRDIEPVARALPLRTFVDYLEEAQESSPTRFDRLMPYLPPLAHEVRERLCADLFVGCDETFTTLDAWVEAESPRDGSYLVVHGAAAAGKSAFLCELSMRKNWPIFFCRITPTAHEFRDFLLAQLATRGGWRDVPVGVREGPVGIAIPALLSALAGAAPPDDQIVFVVDDIDGAAEGGAGQGPLSLPRELPPGLTIVLSSIHSDHAVHFDPNTVRTVNILDRPSLQADIADYCRQRIRVGGFFAVEVDVDQVCTALLKVTDGNWLHTKLLLDDLSESDLAPDSIGSLPTALPPYFTAWWNTWRTNVGPQYWVQTALPVLTVLVGALEPLSPAMVSEVSAVPVGAVDDLVRVEWARHFQVLNGKVVWLALIHREILRTTGGRPFHQGFGDQIRQVHMALADRGRTAAVAEMTDDQQWRGYGLRHTVAHYLAAGALDTATDVVLADAPSWPAAHAMIDSGNSYVQDLERIWSAEPAVAPGALSFNRVRLLRIRAAIHDIAQGSSIFLLAPALRHGLVQRHTLSVLAEVTRGAHARALHLFSNPDTPDGRLAAVAEVDRLVEDDSLDSGRDFLGLVLAYGSDECQAQLFATVNRGVAQGALSVEGAAGLIAHATNDWTLLNWTSDFSGLHKLLPLLRLLPSEVYESAALNLLCQLPFHVSSAEWCREAFGQLVDGDEYDVQLSYLAWSAGELAERAREKSTARAILDQVRAARWARHDESTIASFEAALGEVFSGRILEASPEPDFYYWLDREQDGVQEVPQIPIPGQLDVLIHRIENFLDREFGDLEDYRDRGPSPLDGAQYWRLRRINDRLEDPLGRVRPTGRLLGALDPELATWVAVKELEDLDEIEVGDPFAVDYVLRTSTNSLYLLPWLPDPEFVLNRLIVEAARYPAPVSRRTACVPLAGATGKDQLRAMVELTAAGLGSQEIDLLALMGSTGGASRGYDAFVRASHSVSSAAKFLLSAWRVATIDDEMDEEDAADCLRLLDNDTGNDFIERLTAVQAAVMDPLGVHADYTLEASNNLSELPRSIRQLALRLAEELSPDTAIALIDELATVDKPSVAAVVVEALAKSSVTAPVSDRLVSLIRSCCSPDRDLRSASRLLMALMPCASEIGASYAEAVDVLVEASSIGTPVDRLFAQGIASATSNPRASEALMMASLDDIRSIAHESRLTDEVFEFLVIIDYQRIPAWLVDRRLHRPDNLVPSKTIQDLVDVMADRAAAAEVRRTVEDLERSQQQLYLELACGMVRAAALDHIGIIKRRTDLTGGIPTVPGSESEELASPSVDDIRLLVETCKRFGAENLDGLVEQSGGHRSTEGLAVLAAFESFFGAGLVRAHLTDLIDAEELDVLTGISRSIRLAAESEKAGAVSERTPASSQLAALDEGAEPDSAALWTEAVEMGLPGLIMNHGRRLSTLIAAHPAAFLQPTSIKLLG